MNYERLYIVFTGPPDGPTDENWAEFEDICSEALLDVPGVDDGGFDILDWSSNAIEVQVGFDGAEDPDAAATWFAHGVGGLALYRLADDDRFGERLFDTRRRADRR